MDLSFYFWCSVIFIAVAGLGATENGCDPEFKANVEKCLAHLRGFPVMAANKTFVSGQWHRTEVICRRQLYRSASECVRKEYSTCPRTRAWRSLCGFQNVHPELLLRYGQAVCRHKDVLRQHSGCLNSQLCGLQACLHGYHRSLTSRLSVGMWKSPMYSPLCSYHAYAEHCYEKSLSPQCPTSFCLAQLDVINASRPMVCSVEEILQLKARYRYSEARAVVVNEGASMWQRDSVRRILIGGSLLTVFGIWASVFGLGV